MSPIRSNRAARLAIALTLAFSASYALAQSSMADLYEKVKQQASSEAKHNTERERRFRQSASEQKAMLEEVERRIQAQEALKAELPIESWAE